MKNGVVLYEKGNLHEKADATWTTTRQGLFAIAQNNQDGINSLVTQEGDTTLLERLMEGNVAADMDMFFHIIEP